MIQCAWNAELHNRWPKKDSKKKEWKIESSFKLLFENSLDSTPNDHKSSWIMTNV